MSKPSASQGHGGKQRHSTGPEDASAKSALLPPTSSRTITASKAADANSPGAYKSRKKAHPKEAAGQHAAGSAASPAARASAGGHERRPGEPVQLDTAVPAAADHPPSPSAKTAGLQPKVTSPKASGKHGHGDKRPLQHRRSTKPEPAAKSPLAATYPRSTTSPRSRKDLSAAADATAKSHPSGTSLLPTSGAKAPECLPLPGSEAVPLPGGASAIPNVGSAASRGLSPITSAAVTPLSGASPIGTVACQGLPVASATARFPPDIAAVTHMADIKVPADLLSILSVRASPAGSSSPIPSVASKGAAILHPVRKSLVAKADPVAPEGLSPISAAVSPFSGASPISTEACEDLPDPNTTANAAPGDMPATLPAGTEPHEEILPAISSALSPLGGASPIPSAAGEVLSAANADANIPPSDTTLAPAAGHEAHEGLSPIISAAVSPLGGASPTPTVAGQDLSTTNAAAHVQQQTSAEDVTGEQVHKQLTSSQPVPLQQTAIDSTGACVDSPPTVVPAAEPDKEENRSPNTGADMAASPDYKKRKEIAQNVLAELADLDKIVKTPSPVSDALQEKKRLPLTNAEIAVACLGALAILSFACFLVLVPRPRGIDYRLCSTEDCHRHAALLTARINWQLDPCEDFEAFVCSAWEPSKEYRDMSSSVLDELRFAWYERFADTLRKGSLKLSTGSKPLAMYEMCRNNFPYNESQIALVHSILKSVGLAWPEPPQTLQPPLGLLVGIGYQWQWPFWFTVNMLQPTSSGRRRLLVRQGLTLPITWTHHRSVAGHYIEYWKQFLALLYPDSATRPPVDETAINEIRALEADVVNTLIAATKSSGRRPAAFSFKEIGTHVLNASATEWVNGFQYGMGLRPELTANDKILAHDVFFLQTVGKLMAKYSQRQLNKHLSWLIVQHFGTCTDYSLLVGYTGSKGRAARYLPAYCAFHVEGSFKVLVSSLAYFVRFSARDRETIDSGFKSLVLAAVERINSSSWLDDESKFHASQKLSSVKNTLWPPESLLSDDRLQTLFAGFPQKEPSYAHYLFNAREAGARIRRTPEYDEALMLPDNHYPYYASYEDFTNSVELAMGAATAPVFYSNGTRAMLYGGLFFLMAMQMMKAIDSLGITLTYNGTANQDIILSTLDMREFNNRTKCHHGEKEEDIFPEVPALEVAYAALKESHLGGEDEPLALGEDLPEDRVFFMTLCYLSCARPGYESTVRADCNKIVRNSETFARVYSCPKGAKMNPETKCPFFT
ncbi:endothelin-converting enzyme 2-like [Amblyomma americanum]